MARKVVINVTCDKCNRTVIEFDSVTVEFVVPDEGSYEIDLCLACYKRFNGAYLEMSRPTTKKTRKLLRGDVSEPGEFHCGIGGCEYVGVSPNALGIHKSKTHGIPGKAHAIEGIAFPCTECDFAAATKGALGGHMERAHKMKVTYACEKKGCDFAGTTPQGLSKHMSAKHGVLPAEAQARRLREGL